MKIKINQQENYSIDLPGEMTFQEFQGLIVRLERIHKLFMKDDFSLGVSKVSAKKVKKNNRQERSFTKEQMITGLKTYYQEGSLAFIKVTDITPNSKSYYLRMFKQNVTSQEAGYEQWPERRGRNKIQ